MTDSIMWYDRRTKETKDLTTFFVLLALGVILVAILHTFVEPDILRAEEATVSSEKLIDEGVLCASPITSPDEIDRYCVKLAQQLSL